MKEFNYSKASRYVHCFRYPQNRAISHCLDLDLNGKRPGVTSDGNFSSYLIGRSWYNHFWSFSMGGNGGLHLQGMAQGIFYNVAATWKKANATKVNPGIQRHKIWSSDSTCCWNAGKKIQLIFWHIIMTRTKINVQWGEIDSKSAFF